MHPLERVKVVEGTLAIPNDPSLEKSEGERVKLASGESWSVLGLSDLSLSSSDSQDTLNDSAEILRESLELALTNSASGNRVSTDG